MKLIVMTLALLVSQSTFANESRVRFVTSIFKSSEMVEREFSKLEVERNRSDQPTVVLLAAMGDGCDLMESYLVFQTITSEAYIQKTIAARIELEERDLAECDGLKGTKATAQVTNIVDLMHETKTKSRSRSRR